MKILFISKKKFSKSVVPTIVPGDYAPLCAPVQNSTHSPKTPQVTGSASLWNQKHPDSDFYEDLVVKKLASPLTLTLRTIEDLKD